MTLDDAFFDALTSYIHRERNQAHRVWHHLLAMKRAFLLRSDVQDALAELCAQPDGDSLRNSPLEKLLCRVQEAAVDAAWIYLALRVRVGRWEYMRVHLDNLAQSRFQCPQSLVCWAGHVHVRRKPELCSLCREISRSFWLWQVTQR